MTRVVATTLIIAAWPSVVRADKVSWDVMSDTWVATDALGRSLPGYDKSGPPRKDKIVGIFYFIWHGQHGTAGPFDITKILAAGPRQPQWGPEGMFHHWGEPELGYYLPDDPYVIRRHCDMLVDAGVDVIFLDVTNGFVYQPIYEKLFAIYREIRNEGSRTPEIGFLLNSGAPNVGKWLYEQFYSKHLYSELWFRWQGKPLILASPEGQTPAVQQFFTFRQSWAWSATSWFGDGRDKWPFMDHYPQKSSWHEAGKPEQISVCVAQHPTTNIGRSFHDGKQPTPNEFRSAEGLCFAEQWRRALEVDPAVIFVTGWNEWVAQRFLAKDDGQTFLGRVLKPGETFFVDQYTPEYSRDIEPMKAGYTDNYYYQMIANIRKFKGVRRAEPPSDSKTVSIDGDFADWWDVRPEYRDTIGDTAHRRHAGWGAIGEYVNTTGRNDFVRLRVARDDRHLYFHAQTRQPITSAKDRHWMLLFINIDCSKHTGWEGYDYLINAQVVDSTTSSVARWSPQGRWAPVGTAVYRVSGAQLELAVPRTVLGLADKPDLRFDFHWADNLQQLNDVAEFFVSGDSAPNRRFDYRFSTGAPCTAAEGPASAAAE